MSNGELAKYKRQVSALRRALAEATEPENAIDVGAGAAGLEELMRKTGLYRTEEIRPVRELFLDSRWTLGRMLKKVLRGAVPGTGRGNKGQKSKGAARPTFSAELKRLNLKETAAKEAQRIGTLPEKEKAATYADAEKQDVLPTIELLIDVARPYWYQASRKDKHRAIAAGAQSQSMPDSLGPFPLIYADPPWKFHVYSDMGLDRTPDQHYPTLTDDEIINFEVCGKRIADIVTADAALLMWCTSSNIHRALAIMDAWGFAYKSQAVWIKLGTDGKPISGLGLVFRNMHEVLLYGTRGNMPGPQHQPPSVFFHARGEHSAKPPEIRAEIEKMYPDFDAGTRIELFARETVAGWTAYGFESASKAA